MEKAKGKETSPKLKVISSYYLLREEVVLHFYQQRPSQGLPGKQAGDDLSPSGMPSNTDTNEWIVEGLVFPVTEIESYC